MFLSRKLKYILRSAERLHANLITVPRVATETMRQGKIYDELNGEPNIVNVRNSTKREVIMIDPRVLVTPKPASSAKKCSEMHFETDPFEEIPGPTIFKKVATFVRYTVRQLAMSSLFKTFQNNLQAYGPIVKLPRILGGNILLLKRSEHISEVLRQDDGQPTPSIFDVVEKYRLQRRVKSSQLHHLDGADWEEVRKLGNALPVVADSPHFEQIEATGNSLVKVIQNNRDSRNEIRGDLRTELNKWSLECLCLAVFGKAFKFISSDGIPRPPKASKLLQAITAATEDLWKCESGLELWRFIDTPASLSLNESCEEIERIISEHIYLAQFDSVKTNSKNSSLIKTMLFQECTTPDDVLTKTLDILLVGINSMSSTLGFLLYHMGQNPKAQKILFEELKSVLPEKNSKLEHHKIHSLKYLQACLKESLRLNVPMPVMRRVLPSDVVLSNFRIPKGTYLVMNSQAEFLKEENFDNARAFIPERWFEVEDMNLSSTLPSGITPEMEKLTELPLWSCAAKILRNFHIEYEYEDIQTSGISLSLIEKPLKLKFVPREC